jgi:hypothetical protein
MNERIKQLAKQAGFGVRQNGSEVYTSKLEHLPITENVEKFAELIVQECMSVARGMRNPPNLNYKPSDRFVDELRLHFGVEE